jgi:pyrroloquinoline quinone biosynthesis protein D
MLWQRSICRDNFTKTTTDGGLAMIGDEKVFSLSESVSFQPLGKGEGAVILLIGSGDIFTCNDTTSAFLGSVDGERTFATAVELLADRFDVEGPVLRADLEKLAVDLSAAGIIV